MDWVRLDVDFFDHPRTGVLPERVQLAYLRALAWCGQHETGWKFPKAMVRQFGATPKIVKALVDAELWEPVNYGWHIRDAEDYQPNLDELQALRQMRTERARKAARARWSNASSMPEALLNGCSDDAPAMPQLQKQLQKPSSSSLVFTHDPPDGAADEMISAALRIIADRRIASSQARITNLDGYRKTVVDQLKQDHRRRIDQLRCDPIIASGRWSVDDIANLLEPQPVAPPAIDFAPGSGKLEWFGSAKK